MNPHSFGQPESQLMVSSEDASRTFNSTLEYCLEEAPFSNNPVHFPLNLGKNSIKCGVVEQKLKLEGVNAYISNCSYLLKRKKSSEDSNDVTKHQKSTIFSLSDNVNNDEDEKGMARKIRKRESTHLSRQRTKHYVKELENKFRIFHSTIQYLNANVSYAMAENVTLKAQLVGTGVPAQVLPSPVIYPYPPPWMSYTPSYMMSRQGSQVSLVSIPKLKSQALALVPKSSKNVEKNKSEMKTKKVASVSFLGVLFFMMLFGGLVPLLKLRYGGTTEPSMSGESFVSGFYLKHHGRVLTIDGLVNETGPLLSSGMCTEVFQFDVLASARDISMEERQNGTRLNRNRRILNGPPVSLSRPSHSISEEQTGTNGKQENFSRNKSLSFMVVSVLVDGDGIIGSKSLSRIFVVVLIDSVKYVTYSCMLPFKGSAPLVNAPEDGVFI
ncbi:hypothetical protein R3W88_012031 [Solanum pinnatisectum]|uniref:BZIP domain-containing protein n=1 Tax=Solanum pinnatisectum TaxID=50273 RepID=A0AAV9L972_9SOLN|nr:hypothetical protein R3W88_012031 [Solanum pinnatisectum]